MYVYMLLVTCGNMYNLLWLRTVVMSVRKANAALQQINAAVQNHTVALCTVHE